MPGCARKTPGWITGQTTWTDNIVLPGLLHLAFARSPYAHAKIKRVDVSAALKLPGVVAAFAGADFAAEQGSLPCAWPVTEDIVIPAHPAMAVDEVRYVGEAVAVVVLPGDAAADAVAAIDVDYEPLPAVLDIRRALDEDSPKVHEAGNKSYEWKFANGDLDAAFRDAPVVLERNYRQQRLIPCAMEPRSVVCEAAGRGVHPVVGDPGPARAALPAGRPSPASRSRTSGSSRPTWAAGSAPSSRSRRRKSWPC